MQRPINWNLAAQLGNTIAGTIDDVSEKNRLKDAWTKSGGDYNKLVQELYKMGDTKGAITAAAIADKLNPSPKNHFQADAYGRIFDSQTGEYKNGGGGAPSGATPGAAPGATNPYFFPHKNTDEVKAGSFYNNAKSANDDLEKLGNVPAADDSVSSFAQGIPDGTTLGYFARGFVSKDRQQFEDASDHFINAINRRESGAQVSPAEKRDARSRFIPQYGDKPETIAAKAKARAIALQGIAGEAGPMFDPNKIPETGGPGLSQQDMAKIREYGTAPGQPGPYSGGRSAYDQAGAAGGTGASTPPTPPPPEAQARLVNALKAHPEAEAEIKAAFERKFGNGQKGYADFYLYGSPR